MIRWRTLALLAVLAALAACDKDKTAEPPAEPRKVRLHGAGEHGVGHGGAGALVLPELAGDPVGEGDVQPLAFQGARHPLLVAGVKVGMEEAHRHGVHPQPAQSAPEPLEGLLRQRLEDLAPGAAPLVDPDPKPLRDPLPPRGPSARPRMSAARPIERPGC